jgi:hypothetical protein
MHNYDAELGALSTGIDPMLLTMSGTTLQLSAAPASDFNADLVWADVLEASKVSGYQSIVDSVCPGDTAQEQAMCAQAQSQVSNANFRGAKAANAIRDGLTALGYSPGQIQTPWGSADANAWKAFTGDQNLPSGPGLVNKVGLDRMEALLSGGGGGETIIAKAKSAWPWIVVGVVGALGVGAIMSRR